MKKLAVILLLVSLTFCLLSCAPYEKTDYGFAMGSQYYVKYISSSDLSKEVAHLLSSIEESFSIRVEGSLISRINASAASKEIALTEEETDLLSSVFRISESSDLGYNPTVLPLVEAWGFDPPFYSMNGEVPPSDSTIQAAMALSLPSLFALNAAQHTIVKSEDAAALDLGGAIKGYAAEKVMDLLSEKGVSEALVYLGGTIAALGKSYVIGVTPPRDSDESYAFRFTLGKGEICATSGDYERYFFYNDTRYHHILDSRTGYPASSGVISATVVHENGLYADALATAVVVLGAERGVELLEKCGAKGAIITENKKVITVGLNVTIKDKSYALE